MYSLVSGLAHNFQLTPTKKINAEGVFYILGKILCDKFCQFVCKEREKNVRIDSD
jgi:hypothetical protein